MDGRRLWPWAIRWSSKVLNTYVLKTSNRVHVVYGRALLQVRAQICRKQQ